jgi:hypothetical protein
MVFKNAHAAEVDGGRGGLPTSQRVRVGLSAIALVLAAAQLTGQSAQGLSVVPVVRGDSLVVNVELREGLTPDVRAAIDSGLKTIFTYTVELRLDVPGWIDRTVATSVVTNSVEFDNLQRIHTLERRIDGRNDRSETTTDAARVRQWMTNLKDLPLFSTRVLQQNREYYVRVSATARPSYGSILWPFGSGTSAQTKFVFFR